MSDDPTKARIAYYRERAAEACAKAGTMKAYEARQTMLQVAAMWEAMAKSAEGHSHSN